MYPDLCEKPNNVKEYCLKHPQFCPENKTDWVIPKHGYHTTYSREVFKMSQQLLFNRSDDIPEAFLNPPRRRNTTVTFIQEGVDGYVKCYSENLHLYQSKMKTKTMAVDIDTFVAFQIYRYNLSLQEEESFNPWGRPQAYYAIHPPMNPINPVYEGHAIKAGFTYVVNVKMEEYHLLPDPYPTNCTDYNVRPKNLSETKPRSYEICREMCRSDFFKECVGCDMGVSMHMTTEGFCFDRHVGCINTSRDEQELTDRRSACLKACNPDCVKFEYPYTVVETENERDPETGLRDKNALIVVLVKNPEVKIMSHDPLYANGELFSYIGGLIGCWLGISVWAFTSIFEKFLQKLSIMKANYRRKKEQASSDEKEI